MKLLIAYDGSPPADAAIDDLNMAGLPDTGEALVLSVADVWLPPENLEDGGVENEYIEQIVEKHRQQAREAVEHAREAAERARQQVLTHLPNWTVSAEGSYGSAAWEVIDRSESLDADLIVVGSHGKSAISRFFLGSVSQKVLTEARTSVRVARGRIDVDEKPVNILIGFDASKGAQAAVESVKARSWRRGSKVWLVGVVNPISATRVGQFIPPVMGWVEQENVALERLLDDLASKAAEDLKSTGLEADVRILSGDPKSVLVDEAENVRADCVFMGANRFGSRVERFLLGSVSAAIAARAHCSVEVVRTRT